MYALTEPIPHPDRTFRTRVLLLILILLALATLCFVTPAAGGQVVTEFSIPSGSASDIASGPDGNLWFTESAANQIGRITPNGLVTEFPIPSVGSFPTGIASGPDGNVWFVEQDGNRIGRITPEGVVTEFALPTPDAYLVGIVAGPDGALWFTEANTDRIGRITRDGVVTEFSLPFALSAPLFIAEGPDGNLWFTEALGNRIGRITTTGNVTEFPIPTPGCFPSGIAKGPDGNAWFTELLGLKIGRIAPAGIVTEFEIPTPNSYPADIVAGPDGNLWFTENERSANRIGRITPVGDISEFGVPTAGSHPSSIAAGPDGAVWFTESGANQIGRITMTAPGPCSDGPNALCLNAGRFEVKVAWSAPSQGTSGAGNAVPLTGDTGYFWFFNDANVELVVKVLDGAAWNGHFWVFYGALSNVQYTISVRDSVTGIVKTYQNPDGTLASVADTSAFDATAAGVATAQAVSAADIDVRSAVELHGLDAALTPRVAAPRLAPACTPDGTTLCLNQSRFQLTVDWAAPDQGRSGHGTAVPLTDDTGYFWFFGGDNVELVIKVLDGTAWNGHFWVFYGALSDVQYTITVTDTLTNTVRTYTNPNHTLASVADTSAF